MFSQNLIRFILLTCWVSGITGLMNIANSQGNSGLEYSEKNTFSINDPLEVTLEFNIRDFIRNKDKDEYRPATISYYLPDSTYIERLVNIRPRGNFRRDKCYLPPIKIDFDDSNYHVKEFERMGKVKLVSLCKLSNNFEQYLIKEYLTYKAYELITDYSFETYFMKINFVDSEGKKKPFSGYAFIIEDIDRLAERNNAIEIENTGLLPVHMYRPVMNKLGIFQYMIGNTDWHVPNLHNLKLIKIMDPDYPLPIPVPYDFDYAGIINANYAIPHESLPIDKITERYYMGNCMTDAEFKELKEVFLANKEAIINLFKDCELLQNFNRNSAEAYLNDFFDIISSKKLTENILFEKCD